jgi:pimeloyl-ACP methyl ester carboxylesterase
MVMVSPWSKFSDVISTYPGPWLKPLTALLAWYSNQVLYSKKTEANVWDTGINLSIAIKNMAQYLEKHSVPEYQKLRIHLFHGTHDSVVRIEQAEALMQNIQAQIKQLPARIQKHFEINLHPIEGGDHFTDLKQSKLPMTEIISALNNK